MYWLALCLCWLWSGAALAFSVQDTPDYIPPMPPLPKAKGDALPWEMFLKTKEMQNKITYPDGGYSFVVKPIFDDTLKILHRKEVTLYGFMFPLEQSDKQSNFLIGPFPPSCPFHYHVPPSLIVEVQAIEPVPFSWDEITLRGTLELADKDTNGIFYYLKNATIKK